MKRNPAASNGIRKGGNADVIAAAFLDNLRCLRDCTLENASRNDLYMALSYAVRDRMLGVPTQEIRHPAEPKTGEPGKTVAYLSAEFLPGPHLANNLLCLGLFGETRKAMDRLGINLDDLLDQEEEPGLGNGGLGRLASCFLDSLATLSIDAIGYGIRYEFGIFDQEIRDGWQVEIADTWLRHGNPWEIEKTELSQHVGLGGRTESHGDSAGRYRVEWIPSKVVKGIPHDTPAIGYRNHHRNTLRLWRAEAVSSFDLQDFNVGDYYAAVEEKISSEIISKVLYPNDETESGKKLRLVQQYFFVSCSLKDMIRMHLSRYGAVDTFHERFAVQMNDTHPSLAVAELMRLLVDEYHLDWEKAWEITTGALSYTNHTLLPEALEKWRFDLFRDLLPRHLEIILEINRRFLEGAKARYPGDGERLARLSVVDESGGRYLRMSHLACMGSHAVNGVAELHSELLKRTVLRDFYEMSPHRFINITNGVTPRRWMALCNPGLTALVGRKIGEGWIGNADGLRRLEEFADDGEFRADWRRVKFNNKVNLAARIREVTGIAVDPGSLFDVQAKRIHEYKRQHLNVLHIIALYLRLKRNPEADITPRTCIFSGKAAPGYFMAKLIIKLITATAELINGDPDVRGRLKVVFFPDFNVMNAQKIYPAADLSEQISTAGKEASGTGNMKFAFNGALTIGTLDGANAEIRREVGAENFFLFGLTADEVQEAKSRGYNPASLSGADARLREILDLIRSGLLSPGRPDLFMPLLTGLMDRDEYMLFADFDSYIKCQAEVDLAYRDAERWTRMSILNTARMGKFSSDRAIREYCRDIWKAGPAKGGAPGCPEPESRA
ncbi:MAG: glycogen/starch/alpha-glucan phosphorylase [Acidobacteriota bacterium]|nr:glycogen/starch/alpha-glucan phosphorylase [Acidobacteriota bacterium]